jgi:NADH-quinone oxidoreductase subunit N
MPLGSIIPVLVLLTGAVATLVIGIFLPRRRQSWNAALAAAVVLLAMAAAARDLANPPGLVFDATFMVDQAQLWTALVVMGSALLVGALALPVFRHDQREAEFYTLLLFSALGAVILAGAHDLMEIVLAVLLTSVGSYALVAYRRADRWALEAVLKYYLFGALTNIGLIFGLVLLYGSTGSTLIGDIGYYLDAERQPAVALALVLVFVGLGFKAGYVPAHFWIPDAFQGTTLPVAAWLSAGAKLAALLALYRLVMAVPVEIFDWPLLIAVMAAITMTWGNLAALRQDDLRRLLAYSTIAQSGYLLMAVAAAPASGLALPGLLYYFLAYMLANIGAFAVLAATGGVERRANAGLVRHRPALALSMVVALLSLTGIPPLAGFVGKFMVFAAAFQSGYAWLAAVALANSALSLSYYLRAITPMFFDSPPAAAPPAEFWASSVALFCALATLLAGLAAAGFM